MSTPPYNNNDLLTKPTYDVAFYGEDVIIPLTADTLNLSPIVWSNLDALTQSNDTVANGDRQINPVPRLFSNIDDLGILNEGDGVQFTRTYQWLTDMSAFVYKFDIFMAVGINVTAFTSGVHSVDDVQLVITIRNKGGDQIKQFPTLISTTAMGDQAQVGARVAVLHFEGNTAFKVGEGNIVEFAFTLGRTDTQTATSFDGILPYFYCQEGALPKTLFESAITLHLHPALDHAQIVLRDESIQEGLDYSGVDREGNSRSHNPLGT